MSLAHSIMAQAHAKMAQADRDVSLGCVRRSLPVMASRWCDPPIKERTRLPAWRWQIGVGQSSHAAQGRRCKGVLE